ncbi:MAG: response regulator, partial [Alphaproteobacteria bacterium]|nr:response regulator [Alphaproteobacteria bacterium]
MVEPVNILLVDDQPAKLLSYRAILDDLGENLISAGSAREAFEHLLKIDVAIILIDVVMPELNGFELAAMIRNHPRFERTAIIFVSALALADVDLLKGYEHGAVDYLSVPVVPKLLRAKVRVFAELYRKTRELAALNQELEQRVADRTAELAQANALLEQRVEERTREREMALAQVHEMQKLESLGQLTGGVAHDFNNLLMAILGNLGLVLQGMPEKGPTKRLIEGAVRAAERGATLTKRMLAFARRQELKPETVDIVRHVNGITDMLKRTLGPQIEIVFEPEAALPPITADPNQLELAVLNLALNARDAMANGGRLTIAARRAVPPTASLQNLAPGDYVCVSVTDTGTGMEEAVLKRAAEPFFTTKGPTQGTGLGLSMVFGLAAQSGGLAQISSKLGVGTTVDIWFPVAGTVSGDRAAPTITPLVAPMTAVLTVLLVEDDPMVAESTAFMLEHLGHHVVAASSGVQALKLLESEPEIDLVITDNVMAGMTGIELSERIRRLKPKLPVVLATGYTELPTGGGSGLPRLNKPYRLDKLSSLLLELV